MNRYAAYLVATVRTREAEAASSKPMDELEMAKKHVAVLERERQQREELEVARPKATKWDACCDAEGLIGMTEIASILGINV